MIDLAMTIQPALKQRPEQGCDGEKWILRKACEDLLPAEIVWRGKLQFDEGSGFSDYMADHARREFDAGHIESAGPGVSAEEALYRQLLRDSDVHTDAVMGLTSHWRSGRTVMELGHAHGWSVQAQPVSADALRGADEVFITSTAGGVMPVTRVDDAAIGDGTPGPVTRTLRDAYWGLHEDPRYTLAVDYGRQGGDPRMR